MAKDEGPPQFLKPGDDPEVDALLARLKRDGEDGDPLYVNLQKRRRERLRAEATAGARDVAAPDSAEAAEDTPASDARTAPRAAAARGTAAARPVEPQPVELPAAAPKNAQVRAHTSRAASRATPRWLLWATLAVTAPVVAIAIGFLWSHHRATPAAAAAPARSAAPSASATASNAPPARATANAPVPPATAVPAPNESAQAAPSVSAPPHAPPVKPHGKRVPVLEDPYIDASAPPAPTLTATPSAAPPPPPVRTQTEENREF